MDARDIMTEDPICCTPSDSIQFVAQQMTDNSIGLLPVVDDRSSKHLIGVVSDRDLVCRLLTQDGFACDGATVQDAMTFGNLLFVHPDATVDDVLDMMEQGQVRRIPVVDETNKILGIIATADIALEVDEPDEIAEVFEVISEPTNIPHA